MLSRVRLKNCKLSGQYELFEKKKLMLSEVRLKYFQKGPKMVISTRNFGCWSGQGGDHGSFGPL